MKLVQKQFFRGSRAFEIVGDAIDVRIKSPFREEKLTVMLAVLNPEPVVDGDFLEFRSRIKSDPLLSLLRDKPNSREFNAFVDELKQRAREEYNAFAGLRDGSLPQGMEANIFEDPADFDNPAKNRPAKTARPVNIENLDTTIMMLEQYLDADEIRPLLSALEALRAESQSEPGFGRLVKAFDDLGPRQGAVLTYAPYIGVLLSDSTSGFKS